MHTTTFLGVALLLCASAAGSPAPEDSAAEKEERGRTLPSDLESKGASPDAHGSTVFNRPPDSDRNAGPTGEERNVDAGKESVHLAQQAGPEGIKPK